jgi:hypothetical protein
VISRTQGRVVVQFKGAGFAQGATRTLFNVRVWACMLFNGGIWRGVLFNVGIWTELWAGLTVFARTSLSPVE